MYEHVKKLLPDSSDINKTVNVLTAAFYPCVRRALEWKDDATVEPFQATLQITHDVAVEILMADFARTSLSPLKKDSTVALNSIPHEIPVVCFGDGTAQPLVHFCVFRPIWSCIKQKRALPVPPLQAFHIGEVKDSYVAFEERMFQVFGLFMSIFCDPREPTGRLRTIVGMLRDRCHDFLNECKSKSHYLPFDDRKTTLKKACKRRLFEGVLSRILNLQKDCGCWMRFGGEAPVDYMLFVRREGNRMEVRYGDAKHHASRDNNGLRSEQHAVVAKAKMVHAGLKKQLRKHGLSLEKFDKSHVLLFTNVPTEEAVSPNTFCWSPWTPFVFLNDDAGTANSNAQGVPQKSAP